MNTITDLSELSPLCETYKHFAVFKGGEKVIPINNKQRPPEEQIEIIKTRLNSSICPAGEYEIHCKTTFRADVKPDVIVYNKASGTPEPDKKPIENISDRNKWELEAFKLQWLNNQLTEKVEALQSENKTLIEDLSNYETMIQEFEEAEEIKENEKPSGSLLSEATLKPIEGILQHLVPIFTPIMSSLAESKRLNDKMRITEWNYLMKQRYGDPKKREPDPDPEEDFDMDPFLQSLIQLKKQDPDAYLNFVKEATQQAPDETQEPDPNE